MTMLKLSNHTPGLLVSVRSVAEALSALAGGADVVDVKDPNRGSLGAADADTISAIARAVNGRAPVSAALGELVDLMELPNGGALRSLAGGVSLFKIGLARCSLLNDWKANWQNVIEKIASTSTDGKSQPVAVVYADWRGAQSPSPNEVLTTARQFGCPALLVDTWNKSGGTLFDHWPPDDLQDFITDVRSHDICVVLAGSLTRQNAAAAVRLAPDLFAVRTAACEGGRAGTVSEIRVRELKNAIASGSGSMAIQK